MDNPRLHSIQNICRTGTAALRLAITLAALALSMGLPALAQPSEIVGQMFSYEFQYLSGANPGSFGRGHIVIGSDVGADGLLEDTRVNYSMIAFLSLDSLPNQVFRLEDITSFSPGYDESANNIGMPQVFGRDFSITGRADFETAGPDERYLATVEFPNGTAVYEASAQYTPAVPEPVSMLGAGFIAAGFALIFRRGRRATAVAKNP